MNLGPIKVSLGDKGCENFLSHEIKIAKLK